MSNEHLDIARRLYPAGFDMAAAFADPERLAALERAFESVVEPDFETVAEPGTPPMGDSDTGRARAASGWPAHGVPGFVSAWRDWLSTWESWVIGSPEFVDVDASRVLVLFSVRARSRTHGVEIPVEGANLLTFRAGRISRIELFLEQGRARAAAGLEGGRRSD